jgi:hypothetical protein
MWIYLIFLFPLWFGWSVIKRIEDSHGGFTAKQALDNLVLMAVVAIITPAPWVLLYPPATDVRAPFIILLVESSLVCVFAGMVLCVAAMLIRRRRKMWQQFNKGK